MSPSNSFRRARPFLGTIVDVNIIDDTVTALPLKPFDSAFAAVNRVHQLMSFHHKYSDVSHLNRHAARRPVPVHGEDPLPARRGCRDGDGDGRRRSGGTVRRAAAGGDSGTGGRVLRRHPRSRRRLDREGITV